MTMSVMVSKSSPVVVRASEEPAMAHGIIKLSSFDWDLIGMPVTTLFVFDKPIHEPAETIRKALSQALVHYYPISGRLAAGADDVGDLHIHCTGEGVLFVAASANSALKQVRFFDKSSPDAKELLEELALYYDPAEYGNLSNPLLMVQVTEFSCGGYVVGLTWNHAIADGRGMAQFVRAVGEIARGLSSPSVVPVRFDESLPCLPPSTVALPQVLVSLEPFELACLDITIPSSAINRIKAEYCSNSSGGGQPSSCTVFEVVAAVLWRCRTRAIMSDPEAPAVLSFAADLRGVVGAKDGYYGNCVTAQVVVATSGAVSDGDISDVINLIKHAKDQIPHQFKRNGISSRDQLQALCSQQQIDVRYGMLNLTSWRNLGFEDPDFGSGNPARVMSYVKPMASPVPFSVCLPWKGSDGANVLSVCVKKEHADAFLGELAKFT